MSYFMKTVIVIIAFLVSNSLHSKILHKLFSLQNQFHSNSDNDPDKYCDKATQKKWNTKCNKTKYCNDDFSKPSIFTGSFFI